LVKKMSEQVRVVEIAPSLLHPATGTDWLAVGDAALAVDPLCGDGVGYAVRSALLAVAAIEGEDAGQPGCLAHYRGRLRRAFVAHLNACHEYYSVDILGKEWDTEKVASARGAMYLDSSTREDAFHYILT